MLDPAPALGRCSLLIKGCRTVGLAILAGQLSACAESIDGASSQQKYVSENPAAMMRIGEAAETAQDWAGADTFYRRAAELAPDLASASLAHARMTARQGDLDGALVGLREAHRLHTEDPDITTALGRMLAASKRPAEALAVFEDGLRADPGSAALLVGKGVALDLLRRHAEAQEAYRASLKIDPENTAARNNFALSQARAQGQRPRS